MRRLNIIGLVDHLITRHTGGRTMDHPTLLSFSTPQANIITRYLISIVSRPTPSLFWTKTYSFTFVLLFTYHGATKQGTSSSTQTDPTGQEVAAQEDDVGGSSATSLILKGILFITPCYNCAEKCYVQDRVNIVPSIRVYHFWSILHRERSFRVLFSKTHFHIGI